MDVRYDVVCYGPTNYHVVRSVAKGDEYDRHSDSQAVSKSTVVRVANGQDAMCIAAMLRTHSLD